MAVFLRFIFQYLIIKTFVSYSFFIFKEMIQNAEDAEASEISFILVKNPLTTTDDFLNSHLLISVNNALVSKDDWDGISSIGISNKKRNPYKVGRFGLGMKSLFHVSGNK